MSEMQVGAGCNCAGPQAGGALNDQAIAKAAAWRAEVNAVRQREAKSGNPISYKEALKLASQNRYQKSRDSDDLYMTVRDRYQMALENKREKGKKYKPSGKKNKRPLTMEAAQRILLKYYRDRSDQFKRPLSALKKNIAQCPTTPSGQKRVLKACPKGTRSRAAAREAGCDKAWKFRPGPEADKARRRTGPAIYHINGLDNLCGPKKAAARKASRLYNLKKLTARVRRPLTDDNSVVNPDSGRRIAKGGKLHQQLVKEGRMKA